MIELPLSPDNQFSFRCPIFNVETRFSLCIKLRELMWRGEKVQVRKGCQACMSSGKCPVAQIVHRATFAKVSIDEYGSKAPKVGRIKDDILQRILPVIVQGRHLEVYQVPEVERKLIASANERIKKMIGSIVRTVAQKAESVLGAVPEKPVAAKTESDIERAAQTGDYAAVLNRSADDE